MKNTEGSRCGPSEPCWWESLCSPSRWAPPPPLRHWAGSAPGRHTPRATRCLRHTATTRTRSTTRRNKGNKYDLVHGCKGGTFGYCTQNAVFAPNILGDIGLTTGLIGLTNGTPAAAAGTPAAAAPAAAAPAAAAPAAAAPAAAAPAGTTTPPPPSAWCSPGYWRQDQHLDSWAATGYSPDDNFFDATGVQATRTPQGIAEGAPEDPTLFEVVDNPQWYGGDDTNIVADLLSAAHPEVNYNPPPFRQNALPCPLN